VNWTTAIPGGRAPRDAIGRFTDAIGDIRARHSHGVVVWSTHGAVLQVGVPAAGAERGELGPRPLVPNTGQVILDQDGHHADRLAMCLLDRNTARMTKSTGQPHLVRPPVDLRPVTVDRMRPTFWTGHVTTCGLCDGGGLK